MGEDNKLFTVVENKQPLVGLIWRGKREETENKQIPKKFPQKTVWSLLRLKSYRITILFYMFDKIIYRSNRSVKSLKLEVMMVHGIVEPMICAVAAWELWNGVIGNSGVLNVWRRHEENWLQVEGLSRTRASKGVHVCDVSIVDSAHVALVAWFRLETNVACCEDESKSRQDAAIDAS